jgi:hypothetical protein
MATLAPTRTTATDSRTTLIEGCLLVGIAAMLLRKAWDGQLQWYIHPRYTTLIVVTAIMMVYCPLVAVESCFWPAWR